MSNGRERDEPVMSHRDAKALTRVKIILMGRGQKSARTLSRRERRILRQHAGLVARVTDAAEWERRHR